MRRTANNPVRILATWVALLTLLVASAAVSRWHLGIGNLVASLGIALAKGAIVAWIFMGLRDASMSIRIAASIGAALLLVLVALSTLDMTHRADLAAPYQRPEQLAPVIEQRHAATPRR